MSVLSALCSFLTSELLRFDALSPALSLIKDKVTRRWDPGHSYPWVAQEENASDEPKTCHSLGHCTVSYGREVSREDIR